jgi:hypothetical protein
MRWKLPRLRTTVVLLALAVRLPSLGLPVDGEGARLATALGRALPFVSSPTLLLRLLDLLGALALPPLVLRAARSLGATSASGLAALAAAHPVLVGWAGGPEAGLLGLGTALLLAGLHGRDRAPAGALAVVPLLVPLGLFLVAPSLLRFLRRERRWPWRVGVLLVAGGAAWLGWPPAEPFTSDALARRIFALALVGVPAVSLVVLSPSAARGLRRLPRGTLVGGAAYVLGLLVGLRRGAPSFSWEGFAALVPLVPLVLLAAADAGRRLVRGAILAAVVVVPFVALGPLQRFLAPGWPGPAGRLDRLKTAVEQAAEAAGPDGWVGWALGPGEQATELRLSDLLPGRRSGRLEDLPVESAPSGLALGAVVRADRLDEEVAVGGRTILVATPLARIGDYVVVRLARP